MYYSCTYCGATISKENISKEHIIQNALGGILESTAICCDICNNVVRREIDDKFCKIFNPIITQIKNLKKTNTSSMPSCKGKAKYIDGKTYEVFIKNQAVIDCPEYKKTNKTGLSKADLRNFEIIDYDIEIHQDNFNQGIIKIAYNYAISLGIQHEKIASILRVDIAKDKVEKVTFDAEVIPFVPLNAFDNFIELDSRIKLSHTLILLSHENYLVCYIDLFNTFQNYIILSENWTGEEIYEVYWQIIEKIDRTLPEFNFYRIKHIVTMASIYGVEATLDIDKLKKDVTHVINTESYKKDIQAYISFTLSFNFSTSTKYDIGDKSRSISYYLDEDDYLRINRFRRYTPILTNGNEESHPFYPKYIQN